jgi:hypothetical protein
VTLTSHGARASRWLACEDNKELERRMPMNRRSFWMMALGLSLCLPASLTFAQNRQGGGGGGGFDPSAFKERRLNDLKDQLGATAEEWTVIQPKLDKVLTEQFAQFAGRFSGFGRGTRNRGASDQSNTSRANRPARPGSDSPIAKAAADLKEAVDKKDTPQEEIATKLKALRDARAKAKADLESAQKDLQSVLTPRQEAVLVSNNVLE